MGWVKTPPSSGEPPTLGAFVKAMAFLLVLIVLFLIWVNTQ